MTRLFEAKPFIVAEIGSNFTEFSQAKDSISLARQAGADAVKFQAFDGKALFGFEGKKLGGIPSEWLPLLKEKADACGIEFLCTAFSPELVDAVDPFVSAHKIASSDLCYPQILERVKSKRKPIILSVGASSKGDIEQAMQILRGGPQVVLMYCVSAYPSTQYNLFAMNDLKATFRVPIGLSDHSLCVSYPALSAIHHFGAVAIEKHVNFFDIKTPDSGHSLNGADFKLMCDLLRGKRDYESFNPQPEEKDMFLRHNRRLIAIKDINVGDAFRFGDNFGAYRSLEDDSTGLSPFLWETLAHSNGSKTTIRCGKSIGPNDF